MSNGFALHDCTWECVQEFSYFCPPSQRKLRLEQRRSTDQMRALFPVPSNEAPVAKRARLTQLASTRGASQVMMLVPEAALEQRMQHVCCLNKSKHMAFTEVEPCMHNFWRSAAQVLMPALAAFLAVSNM